jgi:hypothetical protein
MRFHRIVRALRKRCNVCRCLRNSRNQQPEFLFRT